jgi:hypothetical protein
LSSSVFTEFIRRTHSGVSELLTGTTLARMKTLASNP